jgi:hypothetical protein
MKRLLIFFMLPVLVTTAGSTAFAESMRVTYQV